MGDDISIADVFWSMKMLRLIETDYPFQKLHPRMYQWYQRMYARPAFQNEVMAKIRVMSHLWRSKAAIERIFGFGLSKTLKTLIAA